MKIPAEIKKLCPHTYNESAILKQIVGYCKRKKIYFIRVDGSPKIRSAAGKVAFAPSSHAGMPDLLIARDGKLCCVELKTPAGTLSDVQVTRLTDLRAQGIECLVCVSLQGFTEWYDKKGRSFDLPCGIPVYY